jgi:hypothetical protein
MDPSQCGKLYFQVFAVFLNVAASLGSGQSPQKAT